MVERDGNGHSLICVSSRTDVCALASGNNATLDAVRRWCWLRMKHSFPSAPVKSAEVGADSGPWGLTKRDRGSRVLFLAWVDAVIHCAARASFVRRCGFADHQQEHRALLGKGWLLM